MTTRYKKRESTLTSVTWIVEVLDDMIEFSEENGLDLVRSALQQAKKEVQPVLSVGGGVEGNSETDVNLRRSRERSVRAF
jgi:UDP-N-acetyl-D-mannosaminuronic acid transferase (WecB/TagA/CpsF family)